MKTYKQAGKTWKLPDKIHFDSIYKGKRDYAICAYRAVEKGEYFLSGAIVMAYKAPEHIKYSFLVVRPL